VGYRFRRFGDQLPGLLDEKIAVLLRPGGIQASDFRPRRIHHIRWADAKRIELAHGARRFAYTHSSDDKRWTMDPGENRRKLNAPQAFVDSVLALLSLSAGEWLELDELGELSSRLDLVVFDERAQGLSFSLAKDAEGRVICLENGSAARVSEQQLDDFEAQYHTGLLEGLIELFQDE